MLFDYTADQAKQRRGVRLEDQFGRWWGTSIEKTTGDPCSGIAPWGGWTDPLNTPNAYLRVPKHEDGMPIPGKLRVAFPEWIASVRGSEDDWDMAIQQAGKETYKITTREERLDWPNDPVLQGVAGPRPYPPVEILEKARDGDRQLLGLNMDVKTKSIHAEDMTYLEFVKENRCDELGKSRQMSEVGRLWRLHNAYLVEDAKLIEQLEATEEAEIAELEEVEA